MKSKANPGLILVADDSNTIRFLTQQQLHTLGLEADLVVDGESAIQKFTQHNYLLILMDVQMPNCDGLEATITIRRLEQEKVTATPTPIIAMTANPNRELFLACGMNDFLFKPVVLEDLKAILSRWLPANINRSWETTN